MTPNDAQIDVLLRRYAGKSRGDAANDHLDADELNAFAEGAVPPASRARYVSHLADCDNCRKLVSQLSISAGAFTRVEPVAAGPNQSSWWRALFAPAKLKYAAFAAVVIAAVGGVVLFMQHSPDTSLVSRNEPSAQAPGSAVKSSDQAAPQATVEPNAVTNTNRTTNTESLQKTPADQEPDASKVAKDLPPPPKPADTGVLSAPAVDKKGADQPVASKAAPSYAPPPPQESQRAETTTREQQNIAGLPSGPRKSESSAEKQKSAEVAQERDALRDRRGDDDARARGNTPANRRAGEKPSGPQRNADNNIASAGNTGDVRTEERKLSPPASVAKSEDESGTRSVGGRKFRRQGGSWIDSKFQSSMSIKTVSRGSEEFSKLDSGLRSIASQFSGEVIVVWKSKAYRIH